LNFCGDWAIKIPAIPKNIPTKSKFLSFIEYFFLVKLIG
jgi:hypothetical protein